MLVSFFPAIVWPIKSSLPLKKSVSTKSLLNAQNKLTDFENKIIHLGLDQNLIKNLAELFAQPQ